MSEGMVMEETFTDPRDQVICKLKRIRPYTESQLLALHTNNELNNNGHFVDNFIKEALQLDECEFYQNVGKLNKWRELLAKTKRELAQLRAACEEDQNKVWQMNKRVIIKKGRCLDGRQVEGKHTYDEASFQEKRVKSLEQNLLLLRETIVNDYCYHMYMSQATQKQIEYEIHQLTNERDERRKSERIKLLLSALFAFHRRSEIEEDSLNSLIKQWISRLIGSLLECVGCEERLFLLNHVLRCPGGISSWAIGFVQCPSPLDASSVDEAIEILNHCMNMISNILSPVKAREKFINSPPSNTKPNESALEEYWHLVDADVDEGEDVLVNRINLTELDIIHLLKQIPFDEMFKFLTEKHRFPNDSDNGVAFGEHTELSMLKLLAISTKMVQILRQGLLTFNCMRFRTLTDYITHLIKKTVNSVSKFWQACKGSFNNQDTALILRLQVEYDHFILRSVVTILSCQRFGVWKFVSVIPFEGVTESMMWHIVWVFYNNGRDEIDELGGLCPYFSDAYWKSKFNETAIKYLFREKLPSLSSSEAECLLRSLGNMIKSRSSSEIEFINTIACEMFEMSFLVKDVNCKMVATCIENLSECILQHPYILSALLCKIKETNPDNEMIIDLFVKLPMSSWCPSEDIFDILRFWLHDCPIKSLFNRLARVLLIKLNYGFKGDRTPHLKPSHHRTIAVIVYDGIAAQTKQLEPDTQIKCIFSGFNFESAIKCAKSCFLNSYIEWTWRLLLLLKLHERDYPLATLQNDDTPKNTKNSDGLFYPVPNIHTDCDLFPLYKGLQNKNLFALYTALMMTEIGHSASSFDEGVEMLTHLLTNKCYIPCIKILQCFLPVHRDRLSELATNQKFLAAFYQMLILETSTVVDCLIGLIKSQIEDVRDKSDLALFWVKLLCELTHLVYLRYSASWFIAPSRGLQQLVHIIDQMVSFTFLDDTLMNTVVESFSKHMTDIQNTKPPTQGLSRFIPWNSNSRKCDWTTPFHYLWEKYPKRIWLAYLVTRADALRMEKIWEAILNEMSTNIDMQPDFAVKTICDRFFRSSIPITLLPVNEWAKIILDSSSSHPLLPLVWFNFFSNFFANSTTGGSSGLRLVPDTLLKRLKTKLDQLIDHHHQIITQPKKDFESELNPAELEFHTELVKFYRAAILWLQDFHLHDAYIDIEHLPPQYQIEMLKFVMNSVDTTFKSFVDEGKIEEQSVYYSQQWNDVISFKIQTVTENIPRTMSSSLNSLTLERVGPPEEKVPNIMFYDIESLELLANNPNVVMKYLKDNVRTLMDEKSYFDNRTQKLYNLNLSLVDLVAHLYSNVKKEMQLKAVCDRDGYDPDGCSGPAILTIEYKEATESFENAKNIERNRTDFANLLNELWDLPSDKTICATIFIEKCIPLLIRNMDKTSSTDPCECLLRYYLTWIEDNSAITFAPAKHLFNLLIDSLNFNAELQRDNNSFFLLQSSIERPSIIEYLAPRLAPSKCTITCFLQMYELLQKNLYKTPPHILFVLLSKFDVNSWLRMASDDKCHQFLNLLISALFAMGPNPDPDKSMLLGLYRKHLQYMVICRFPMYLQSVIQHLLRGMDTFVLFPALWNDVLLSFGFYLPANKTKLSDLVLEMRKYAENQPIFSTSELHNLFTLFSTHFNRIKEEKSKIDLMEYFRDYVNPFSIILSTISFMWTHINRKEGGSFDSVWTPFYETWRPWLISSDASQTVDKKDFDHIWDLFICNIRYLLHTYDECCSTILSYTWRILADYYSVTKASSHLTYSEAIQAKLKSLPWNYYTPTQEDIKLMFDASQHEVCPPSLIIQHILCNVNWNSCVQRLPYENIPQAMEWLTYTIIYAIDKSDMLEISEMPIYMVNSDRAKSICRMLRQKIKLTSLITNKSDINRFWMKIVKIACALTISEENFRSDTLREDYKRKQIIYVDTISGLILDSVRNEPIILKDDSEKVAQFLKTCLDDVKASLSEGSQHRMVLFVVLLKFINNITIHDPSHRMLRVILDMVSGNKTHIMEIIICSRHSIKFLPLLIHLSERCITLYAFADGKLEELVQNFSIPDTFDSDVFHICEQNQAHLTLYLIFQSERSTKNIVPLLASMIDWACQLKPVPNTEAKILPLWYMLVKDACYYASPEESCNPMICSTLKFCKTQFTLVDEVVQQGFLSFMNKFTRKSISSKSAFLTVALAGFLLKKLNETLPTFHPSSNEITSLIKSTIGRLQTIKKHKAFSEVVPLTEKAIELMESERKIDLEGIRLLRSWMVAYYSDNAVFRFILTEREMENNIVMDDDKKSVKIGKEQVISQNS